MKAINSK